MDNNEDFSFTYSAALQQEIENIRKKYLPKEADKMEQLRTLHHSATKKAKACSITLGILGVLILGTGMSFTLTDLGEILGAYRALSMIIGILVGLFGLVLVALAYPVYNRVLQKQRQRIAPQILRLTDELLK